MFQGCEGTEEPAHPSPDRGATRVDSAVSVVEGGVGVVVGCGGGGEVEGVDAGGIGFEEGERGLEACGWGEGGWESEEGGGCGGHVWIMEVMKRLDIG